jgi:hypothetical protein
MVSNYTRDLFCSIDTLDSASGIFYLSLIYILYMKGYFEMNSRCNIYQSISLLGLGVFSF